MHSPRCSPWNTRLAALVESYGIHASALAGHSIGEYVAATLAGVFDLPTAIPAVSARARLMHAAPPGAMVAVALGPDDIVKHLSPGLDIAAINDPGNCVVSGPADDMRRIRGPARRAGIAARRMRTSHAFHSRFHGCGAAGIRETSCHGLQLREPHTPPTVEHHRNMDVRRRSDRPGPVGAADSCHGQILR